MLRLFKYMVNSLLIIAVLPFQEAGVTWLNRQPLKRLESVGRHRRNKYRSTKEHREDRIPRIYFR
jgi:hypothetical protein